MRYHDRLDPSRVPDPGAFVVLVDGGVRTVISVEVIGRDVRLTLDPPVSAANSVLARYEDPGDPEAAALQDVNGNRVESVPENWWGMRTVANLTPPGNLPDLTATFSNLPASHDGSTPFDFNVTFSEMVWIARGAPRYGMLTVEGGEVTSAHRLNRRSVLWEGTIQPETQGDIMVTLPVGNCSSENANGMPCAVGGRALASEVATMIPGPDSMQQLVENTPAGGSPEITGNAQVGQTLMADTTGITDSDGLQDAAFTYQWLTDDSEIPGATNVTYTVDSDNVGKAIKVRVDFTDDTGNVESLTSAPTDTVTAADLELQSATVNGATLTLTYSTNLDVSATPPISAFTVNATIWSAPSTP